jgi:TolB-like protein/DNA-binding winged helix-turn-helix (wHTH) protein/Tfp pilus assembly protein PilF
MYVLGSTYLDTEKQLLVTADQTVALQRKPYLVLLHLIENRHRMITRDELLERFWGGQEVYDQSVSKAIGSIRRAFGESATSSRFIETRWGSGYRYVGPFTEQTQVGVGSAVEGVTESELSDITDSGDSNRGKLGDSNAADQGTPGDGLGRDAETSNVHRPVTEPLSAEGPRTAPTRDSAKGSGEVPAGKSSNRTVRVYLAAAVIAAAALFGFLGAERWRHPSETQAATATVADPARSVAVLPFQVDQGSAEDTYLGVGFSDAIADRLKTVEQLTVRSSSTIRTVLGKEPDAKTAAEKLRVQAVVEGNLHREAGKIIVKVRVFGQTGAELWSDTFSANNENIFSAEDSIAKQVLTAILPHFEGQPVKTLSGPETAKYEAYEKYMKAEFFATNRSRSSLTKAVGLLEEAITIDPNYARAYAAMANCYQLIGFYEYLPPSEAYPRAEEAARKAMSLDNSNSEAHVAMLSALTDYEHDWVGAEREFKATVAIDPNYAAAYQYYGFSLLGMGRGEEAVAVTKRAQQLDPVSPSVQTSLAWALFLMRRNEESEQECKRALELYPDFIPAHQLLGLVYGQMNDNNAALTEFSEAEALERDNPVTLILITFELARSEKKTEARQSLQGALARPGAAVVPDYYIAATWAEIGDKGKALESLKRADQHHSNWLIYLPYDPRFDSLRGDPGFKAAFQKSGGRKDVSLSARK